MRPAGLRQPNPFVKPKKRSGGKKLGLDLEKIKVTPPDNYNAAMEEVSRTLRFLRRELLLAEEHRKWSKARKMRRWINEQLEIELYLRHSWCGGCRNVLHNCTCKKEG